ncbi:MAG: DUF309 domain-containing protein [Proteobacteria bacterium]|nr:DUF309 domain-containing protein [Pseudomonadota bacterium]MBU4297085.1 DUF309 domain-containing protein [Pseudomonadota bacterium]MCG2749966.1 DUF309 domain-containing protein [Desulfobulbaceae bacterium]
MIKNNFDPFRDRQARQIRNILSTAFVQSLRDLNPASFETTGEQLLKQKISADKKAYILDRISRYRKCITTVEQQGIQSILEQSFVLWDAELFFEVHEILEGQWMVAQGREKAALQGLIRAAGVYILMAWGNQQGAEKMAAKAVRALEENLTALAYFPSPQQLLTSLRNLDPVPPKLRG